MYTCSAAEINNAKLGQCREGVHVVDWVRFELETELIVFAVFVSAAEPLWYRAGHRSSGHQGGRDLNKSRNQSQGSGERREFKYYIKYLQFFFKVSLRYFVLSLHRVHVNEAAAVSRMPWDDNTIYHSYKSPCSASPSPLRTETLRSSSSSCADTTTSWLTGN